MKTWKGTIIVAYKTNPWRLLLVENKASGKITCPGGAVEEGEEPATAAVRELEEEVGWKVNKEELTATGIRHEFVYGQNKPERVGDSACNEIFLLNADKLPEPSETNDAKNAAWHKTEEGLKKMSFGEVTELVKTAMERIKES